MQPLQDAMRAQDTDKIKELTLKSSEYLRSELAKLSVFADNSRKAFESQQRTLKQASINLNKLFKECMTVYKYSKQTTKSFWEFHKEINKAREIKKSNSFLLESEKTVKDGSKEPVLLNEMKI